MDPDDLISFSDAAREIGCSRTTLYRAANDGHLNDVEVDGRRMLLKGEAWEDFEPIRTGARAQERSDEDETCCATIASTEMGDSSEEFPTSTTKTGGCKARRCS